MANELQLTGKMEYEDSFGTVIESGVVARKVSPSTKRCVKHVQNIGTAEEAIDLGDITPAYAMFKNLDHTNYVELKVATGGAVFAKLRADTAQDGTGGFAILELGSGAQAPFAIANTAACNVEVTIFSA